MKKISFVYGSDLSFWTIIPTFVAGYDKETKEGGFGFAWLCFHLLINLRFK